MTNISSSTPFFLNLYLCSVLISDFILLFCGKMTEFSWRYPGHAEVKRNAFKKHASSWLPGHLEDKRHWKEHMRCYCTKARGTWDDSLLDLQFSPAQSLHSQQANPCSAGEGQFQSRGLLLNSWTWREAGTPRRCLGLTLVCKGRRKEISYPLGHSVS